MADNEAPFPTQSLSPGNGGTTDITEETLHSKKKKKLFCWRQRLLRVTETELKLN